MLLLPLIGEDIYTTEKIFNENHVSKGGFLYSLSSQPSRKDLVDFDIKVYTLKNTADSNPLGYVKVTLHAHKDVSDSELLYYEDVSEALYISQCAVMKNYQKGGLGKVMFDLLFRMYPDKIFLSHVSVRNLPSLKLHYRHNFKKLGVYQSEDFYGYGGYVSDLVIRHPARGS
ncbi:hypothetical protein D3C71_1022760 [compost metagenome]